MPILNEISALVKRIPTSMQEILNERVIQIRAEIQQGVKKPYKQVLNLSSGDPQALSLKPLTFVRQVLAGCLYPTLLHGDTLPADVRQRVQKLLGECAGEGTWSHLETHGIRKLQHSISDFISRRDGVASDPDNIYITNGSTAAFMTLLKLFVPNGSSLQTGVLTPEPSYNGFKFALAAQGALVVPYYLREEQGWAVQLDELHRAVLTAKGYCNLMALYVINPGNPTGHVQTKDSIKDVIRFAAEERLIIMADEVYQSCMIGEGMEFCSYKRALMEMGAPYSNMVELASINSISKGLMGECGLRGGYVELVNFDPSMKQNIFKLFSAMPCASLMGQIALHVMVDPPRPGQPSYPLYTNEIQSNKRAIINNVRRTLGVLNSLPAITWQPVMGGMFAFPRVSFSQAAINYSQERGQEPDVMYCLRLLEDEGLCFLPGYELGMTEGIYHIRITLAAQEEIMKEALQRLKNFHLRFLKEFPTLERPGGNTNPDPLTATASSVMGHADPNTPLGWRH
ncbi:alanine aminotransferase 2-like [Electrophorus electricus]|uniref:alanine aminotransferase 2-like n=1 Tax=Electrophorus electricus TaxID=8005 RepID=UPI0015CF92AD|nr:alanine aminotransferase 2-like [Electrophorus electricus]